ncbi:MAG: hypothetical protein ABII90_07875 [Bacteroidota bacterium]
MLPFFEKSGIFKLTEKLEDFISQTIMGSNQDMTMTFTEKYGFVVDRLDEKGNYWMTVTYKKVYFKQESDFLGVSEYDSDNPPEDIDIVEQSYARLTGKSFT